MVARNHLNEIIWRVRASIINSEGEVEQDATDIIRENWLKWTVGQDVFCQLVKGQNLLAGNQYVGQLIWTCSKHEYYWDEDVL